MKKLPLYNKSDKTGVSIGAEHSGGNSKSWAEYTDRNAGSVNKKRYFGLKSAVFSALTAAFTFTWALYPHTDVSAKQWGMQSPGVYKLIDGSTLNGVVARGIDVSHWQGKIDCKAVAADDVKFVMLGTRSQGRPDPTFDYNASSAHKEGIALGAYIYSYATNTKQAEAEADLVLNLIKDYPISYPVAFDAEDEATLGKLPKSQITAIILTFTNKIRAAGYYPIIYANDYWIANKLDLDALAGIDIWVARYNKRHAYSKPVMWQATETGSVNGIKGNVDIDFQYKDFSSVIPKDTTRTIAGKTYYYRDYVLQKDTLITDEKGQKIYIDKNGNAITGWSVVDGKKFYYDPSTGKTVTSWFKVGDTWYFFDKDGVLQTGWLNKDKLWYLLSSDNGSMQTGWVKDNNIYYYFDASGVMQTGWVLHDSQWYYLNSSGAMQTGYIVVNDNRYYLDTDGHMLKNTNIVHEGSIFVIDENGVMGPPIGTSQSPEGTKISSKNIDKSKSVDMVYEQRIESSAAFEAATETSPAQTKAAHKSKNKKGSKKSKNKDTATDDENCPDGCTNANVDTKSPGQP